MQSPITWVVVADGGRARFLEHRGVGQGLTHLDRPNWHNDVPPSRDLVSDKPGRVQESAAPGSRDAGPKVDPHEQEELRFAHRLAQELEADAKDGAYERLIVVAAPRFLGELREAYGKHIKDRLIGEVPKDLSKADLDQIAKAIDGVVAA